MCDYFPGIDSRYNDGCTELASYLFFNVFELRREEFERYYLSVILYIILLHVHAKIKHA